MSRLIRLTSLFASIALVSLPVGCGESLSEQAKPDPGYKPPFAREAELVDLQTAKSENPNLEEVENSINASDPLSAYAQAGSAAVSKVMVPVIESEAQAFRALNDRYPTADELRERFQNAGTKITGLKPGQMYGYDAETGKVTILLDPEAAEAAKVNP